MSSRHPEENIKHVNRNNLRNGKLYMNVILKLLKLIQFQHGDHVKYYNLASKTHTKNTSNWDILIGKKTQNNKLCVCMTLICN
jgi:hypothetical protein